MTEDFKIGQRVIVHGEHDGESFAGETGTIAKTYDWMDDHYCVRFDTPRARFHQGADADEERHWFFNKYEGGYTIKGIGPSTYLNGLDAFEPRYEWSEDPIEQSARPRFMTAWLHGGPETFTPTGDAFKTLEAAEEFARETLENNGEEDQIAVFEIRSVHLARLDITSEVA